MKDRKNDVTSTRTEQVLPWVSFLITLTFITFVVITGRVMINHYLMKDGSKLTFSNSLAGILGVPSSAELQEYFFNSYWAIQIIQSLFWFTISCWIVYVIYLIISIKNQEKLDKRK